MDGTSYLFDTELIRRHKNVGILNTEEQEEMLWTLLFLGFDEIGNKNEESSFLKKKTKGNYWCLICRIEFEF